MLITVEQAIEMSEKGMFFKLGDGKLKGFIFERGV